MALEHKTIIGGLNIDRYGNGSVLLRLLVVDGVVEYSHENHRVMILRGANLAAKAAEINAILASKGRAPLPAAAANIVGKTLAACWAAFDAAGIPVPPQTPV